MLLYPNPKRDINYDTTRRVAALLREIGLTPLKDDSVPSTVEAVSVSPEEGIARADLLITLGGDGTILHVAFAAANAKKPILGINMGKVGFMAEIEKDEIELLRGLVSLPLRLDSRMMLDVRVERAEKEIYTGLSLNEAVITNGRIARTVRVDLWADDHYLTRLNGDGIIICTPTGSTAYSMAAGGPIVEPQSDNITITPICAYALYAKSFVLAPERHVTVQNVGAEEESAYLTIDGIPALPMEESDRLLVRKSEYRCDLVNLKNRNFYDIIADKLGGQALSVR
ncbi:NAD(+)/NADH kinase [Oscillospiraceae bacterium OttesenSCG-928-G22]|nr:NAD(+)/NADH kinase [Oscillospiraceae bacterium OttesenSCG-928-G22]